MPMPPLLDRRRGLGLAVVAGLTLIQGGAAAAAAFATRGLFEAMHQGGALPVAGVVVLVGAGTAIAGARVAARQVGERIGQGYARDIRDALFDHAAGMPARAAATRRAGYMSLRFVGDMTAFRNWLALGLPRLIAAVVLVPAMLAVLWLLSPVFALAVAPVLAGALLLICWGGLRLLPMQRRLRMRRARIAAEMAERMPIAPFLDRLGRRGTERRLLRKRTDAMVRAALRHRLGVEVLKALPDLAAGTAAALVVVVGYRAGLGTGDIAAALAALGLLLAPLRDLGGVWNHRAAHKVARAKAEAALSRVQRDVYRAGKAMLRGPVDVVFEDLRLPSGSVLSFRAPGGATSDLVIPELDAEWLGDVLLGLDAAGTGRVLLGGIDIRDLSRGALRRNVGSLVAQPAILQGSLRRALVMGCDTRPDDVTLEALARAQGLGGLLDRLGGLGGTVLERGRNLTQAERLAIARARILLARPRVVVVEHDIPAIDAATGDEWPGVWRGKDGRGGTTVIRLRVQGQEIVTAA
jgi:ABC-type multidrug transport system fused ATPase/permease subunit